MFGFNDPEDGSQVRYEDGQKHLEKPSVPWLQHRVWWIVHNAVSHPLIAFFPCKSTFDFHDMTSNRMHGVTRSARLVKMQARAAAAREKAGLA